MLESKVKVLVIPNSDLSWDCLDVALPSLLLIGFY